MHSPWLPEGLRVLWAVLLVGVTVLHAAHMTVMSGQRRWWHTTHTAMATGMMLMYLLPPVSMSWMPQYQAGFALFGVATVLAAAAVLVLRNREGTVNPLWMATALDLLAMTYMLLPMHLRVPVAGYAVALCLTAEAAAWTFGLWRRVPALRAAPATVGAAGPEVSASAVGLTADWGAEVPPSLAVMAASMAYMLAVMA